MSGIGEGRMGGGLISSPDIGRGISVADSVGTERVRLGQITAPSEDNPTGDYGLKVVSSDGATVVIDGTSNMFKIAASGTLAITPPAAGAATQASVTLSTGFAYGPTLLGFLEIAGTAWTDILPWIFINDATGAVRDLVFMYLSFTTSPDINTVFVEWKSPSGLFAGGGDKTTRYFVLKEAAF
jgi:hypothetical protein